MKQPNEEQESHVILETRIVQPFAWLILMAIFALAVVVWRVDVMLISAIGLYLCFERKNRVV